MQARIPRFGAHGHGCGREVLHLFEFEVEGFGLGCEGRHVFVVAAGVGADEVGDDLLIESVAAINVVEKFLELVEEFERGLSHELQHGVGSVFGSHLEASRHVVANQLFGIFLLSVVNGFISAAMQNEVVAHTASHEALFDAGQRVDGMVDGKEWPVVGVEVFANGRVNAAGACALPAQAQVVASHAIHVGRRAAEVGEVALEVGHLGDLSDLAQYALLRSAHDELSLVGRNGAECAASEASAVKADGVAYHFVGRYAFAAILGVGHSCVGQVERSIYLFGGEGRVGRKDYKHVCPHSLQQSVGLHAVALGFDVPKVFGIFPFVGQGLFVGMEHYVVGANALGHLVLGAEHDGLAHGVTAQRGLEVGYSAIAVGPVVQYAVFQALAEFADGQFAHAVNEQVGTAVAQDAWPHAFLPIVVVGEPP